jgi:hypothetical protein
MAGRQTTTIAWRHWAEQAKSWLDPYSLARYSPTTVRPATKAEGGTWCSPGGPSRGGDVTMKQERWSRGRRAGTTPSSAGLAPASRRLAAPTNGSGFKVTPTDSSGALRFASDYRGRWAGSERDDEEAEQALVALMSPRCAPPKSSACSSGSSSGGRPSPSSLLLPPSSPLLLRWTGENARGRRQNRDKAGWRGFYKASG